MLVVFDIGNVLLRWDPRHLFARHFADPADMERFLSGACAMDWIFETDRAQNFKPLVEARIAQWPDDAPYLRLFDENWLETVAGPIVENVDLLDRLRRQGAVYCISNFCAEKFDLARRVYPFLDWFSGAIVSGREGIAKPDPRIFELFLRRFDLAADACLFIDDSEKNIFAARQVGMEAIHYTPGLDLAAALRERGVFLADAS